MISESLDPAMAKTSLSNLSVSAATYDYDFEQLSDITNGTPGFHIDPGFIEEYMKNMSKRFETDFDAMKEPSWRAVVITLYIVVIVMGVVFNGVVICILARNRTMWNVTNVFIGNLALSDIFLCLFNLPFQLHYQLTENWIFGDILCHIIPPLFALPVHVSAITMLLIAMDRYWLIIYPLKDRMSLKTAILLMIVSSTVSVIVAIPLMVLSSNQIISHPDLGIYRRICREIWPVNSGRIAYTSLIFSVQFCLPVIATSLMYGRIYLKLRCRPIQHSDNRRKHRTNKILMSIVLVFFCCWLPWNLFALINEYSQQNHHVGRFYKFTDLVLKIFAVSSACINPFLYGWFNDNFRKEMNSFLVKMRKDGSLGIKRQGYRDEMTEDLNGRSACDPLNNCTITIDRITTAENIM